MPRLHSWLLAFRKQLASTLSCGLSVPSAPGRSAVSQLSETPDYFMVSSIKLPAFPNGGIKGSTDLKMATYTGSSRETNHLKKNYHSTRYREVFVCLPDHCPLFSPWFCILGGQSLGTNSMCFFTFLLLKRPVQWEALAGDLPVGAPLNNAVLR